MIILVSNDDGIEARGIHELVRALHEDAGANVYVCAPNGQRSASSHAINFGKEIVVEKAEFDNAELAWSTTGSPADCVKIGMLLLQKEGIKVDMVFAGINHGSNIGTDTIYSGTVGAALEGTVCGVPSVAVSVGSHHAEHFELACALAVDSIKKAFGKMSSRTALNINVPNKPANEVKGVVYTTLGDKAYVNDLVPIREEEGKTVYTYGGKPRQVEGEPLTNDVVAEQNGYASITPLNTDLTHYEAVEDVESWRIGK